MSFRNFSFLLMLIGIQTVSAQKPNSPPKPTEVKKSQQLNRLLINDEDRIFSKVEFEAEFPGGIGAWRTFLENNLNGEVATKNNAPAGAYTVVVKFTVAKDGSVSDIQAESKIGYGMEEEVVRILKISPNWKPAFQAGKIVRAYRRQPVTFVIADEEQISDSTSKETLQGNVAPALFIIKSITINKKMVLKDILTSKSRVIFNKLSSNGADMQQSFVSGVSVQPINNTLHLCWSSQKSLPPLGFNQWRSVLFKLNAFSIVSIG